MESNTGRKAVEISIHEKKAFFDSCMLGMTLTNNMDIRPTKLSARMTFYIRGNVECSAITRNFTQVKIPEQQGREDLPCVLYSLP